MFVRPANKIKFGQQATERRITRAKASFIDDAKKQKEPFADAVKRHLEALELEELGTQTIKKKQELPVIRNQ